MFAADLGVYVVQEEAGDACQDGTVVPWQHG